jgi:hypothetical protein
LSSVGGDSKAASERKPEHKILIMNTMQQTMNPFSGISAIQQSVAKAPAVKPGCRTKPCPTPGMLLEVRRASRWEGWVWAALGITAGLLMGLSIIF